MARPCSLLVASPHSTHTHTHTHFGVQGSYPLATVSIKKGSYSDNWPWPVEILHKQETIHASLSSDKDRNSLIECVGRQEGVPNKVGVANKGM